MELSPNDPASCRELDLASDEDPTSAFKRWTAGLPEPEPDPLPGVLDDGPVSARQVITLSTVRKVLRDDRMTGPCIVFSTTHGTETLMPSEIAQRCDGGWRGVLIAGPADLPEALIKSWAETAIAAHEDEPQTGRQSGPSQEDGERLLVQWSRSSGGTATVEHDLRILSLARGVSDLRTISTADERGYSSLSERIWHALLTSRPLDLTPFAGADHHRESLELPLGVLSTVQVYTSRGATTTTRTG